MAKNSPWVHMTFNVFTNAQLEILWQVVKIFQIFVEKVCSTGDISVHSTFFVHIRCILRCRNQHMLYVAAYIIYVYMRQHKALWGLLNVDYRVCSNSQTNDSPELYCRTLRLDWWGKYQQVRSITSSLQNKLDLVTIPTGNTNCGSSIS